ncbi:MAG: DUF739 family protein [Oscillospiraceae bacterium]|nr:DUF739 family protein [Oscillospiraceae bacterium]
MNIDDLNAEIARQGLTKPQLAKQMGISKKRLYSRLKGETTFKQEEIQKIASILHLDNNKIMNIFFAELVS